MDHQNPIVIDDEDDFSDASSVTLDNDPDRFYFLREGFQATTPFVSLPGDVIDLTHNEGVHDGDYVTDDVLEILLEEWQISQTAARPSSQLELPQEKPLEEVCGADGIVFMPGQSVEIHDDTYLRIGTIWQDADGEIFLQGRRLRRLRRRASDFDSVNGAYLPQWRNELVWKVHEAEVVPIGFVQRFVSIRFTNHCHVKTDPQKDTNSKDLFCRLKENIQENSVSVQYLTHDEADVGFRMKPDILRRCWRGETARLGSKEVDEPFIVLDEAGESQQPDSRLKHEYTFGDGFCGAGGVSCGAELAGLHIKWAFDRCPEAAATYRLNFGTVECDTSDVFDFLSSDEEFLKVDVTHGSPPCQTFSRAKTIPCANDDANSACIFSGGDIVRRARSRVHTMEETSGLIEGHEEDFCGVIRDFLETGYSVRWAILNCVGYGVPQLRKRLVVIAAGPGENLPAMPRPTHGPPNSGLRNFLTINQTISAIPPGANDHDVEAARRRFGKKRPFDGNQQARTITCNGGENYHPSGQRGFTTREYASLQTFPLDFQFKKNARKQIGNAVPPVLARAIYEEVIRSLQETDEREMREDR
ncbi:S-adenosyl-L-methionine-dependent methyltransferase [Aspergillus venezuelensis]